MILPDTIWMNTIWKGHNLDTHLLSSAFHQDDVLTVAIGFDIKQLKSLVAALADKGGRQELSIIARDTTDRRMLGAVLAIDFCAHPDADLDAIAPDFAPIGAILDELDQAYPACSQFVPGQCLHIFMVGGRVAQMAARLDKKWLPLVSSMRSAVAIVLRWLKPRAPPHKSYFIILVFKISSRHVTQIFALTVSMCLHRSQNPKGLSWLKNLFRER